MLILNCLISLLSGLVIYVLYSNKKFKLDNKTYINYITLLGWSLVILPLTTWFLIKFYILTTDKNQQSYLFIWFIILNALFVLIYYKYFKLFIQIHINLKKEYTPNFIIYVSLWFINIILYMILCYWYWSLPIN